MSEAFTWGRFLIYGCPEVVAEIKSRISSLS
jgi:hypothetical protein